MEIQLNCDNQLGDQLTLTLMELAPLFFSVAMGAVINDIASSSLKKKGLLK